MKQDSTRTRRIIVSIGFWLAVLGLLVVLDPGQARSSQTGNDDCSNPLLTAADLDALPAIEPGSLSDEHLMPYPPPSGRPIDYFTAGQIQEFLDHSTACINAGYPAARFSDYTPDLLSRMLAVDSAQLEAVTTDSGSVPLDPPVDCTLIRAWMIDSGHVVAVVQMTPDLAFNTLLLLPEGKAWMVDDRWNGLGESLLGDAGTGPFFAQPVNPESTPTARELVPTRALW